MPQRVGAAEPGPAGDRVDGQVGGLQQELGALQPLLEQPRCGVMPVAARKCRAKLRADMFARLPGGGSRAYFEARRPDGAHELRTMLL